MAFVSEYSQAEAIKSTPLSLAINNCIRSLNERHSNGPVTRVTFTKIMRLLSRQRKSFSQGRRRSLNNILIKNGIRPISESLDPPKKQYQTSSQRIAFYDSREWQELRYKALKHYGIKCMVCAASNCELHVDHIKPRSKFPELELQFSNLQILCRACNMGKGAWDETDWRKKNPSGR